MNNVFLGVDEKHFPIAGAQLTGLAILRIFKQIVTEAKTSFCDYVFFRKQAGNQVHTGNVNTNTGE